jgi:hypothetical protein
VGSTTTNYAWDINAAVPRLATESQGGNVAPAAMGRPQVDGRDGCRASAGTGDRVLPSSTPFAK